MQTDRKSNELTFFKSVGNVVRNVHLDWLGDHTRFGMAEGFKQAGDHVVDATMESARHPDIFFHPVAYLYRHSLELQFKNIICEGHRLLARKDSGQIHGHRLPELWAEVKKIVQEVWPDGDSSRLEIIGTAVKEFSELDATGQAFRYVQDTRGKRNLDDAPRVISLANLKEKMDETYRLLSACETGIRHLIDCREESLRYARDY